MLKNFYPIEYLEKKLISKENRFKLKNEEIKQIKKKFNNSTLFVIGAAGSIGSKFVLKILNYKFKKIYLLDKDENQLTELNRNINEINKKKNIEYICNDIIFFDVLNFIKKNKINHILNFSALKHVRSEENIFSLEYMLRVNSIFFLNHKFPRFVKSVFSVSTDKVVKPTSFLGISKKLMEFVLHDIKKTNSKIHVSSARFANVSFSNGSILKSIFDRVLSNKVCGVPSNINRYFITHSEATSICLISLIEENNGYTVVLKESEKIKKQNIKKLTFKIISILNKNYNKIKILNSITQGQKKIEDLKDESEIYENIKYNKNLIKTKLVASKEIKKIKSYFLKNNIYKNQKKIAKLIYKDFIEKVTKTKLSKNI